MKHNGNQGSEGPTGQSTLKQLPERPSLEHLRAQARDLLTAFRAGDPTAELRLKSTLPSLSKLEPGQPIEKHIALHDAQSVIAREYGFETWRKLNEHVQDTRARQGITQEVVNQFVELATSDRTEALAGMLKRYPSLPRHSAIAALLCGETSFVSDWIASNPKLATEKLAQKDWAPLEYVCYTRVHQVRPESYAGLQECAEVLLNAGADPNTGHATEEDPSSPLPVLYGASDHAAHPGLVRLLLERGANPNDGESVYHAAQHNRREILEVLLEHGADISSKHPYWNNTPLFFLAGHRASDAEAPDALLGSDWLLQNGADPNVRCGSTEAAPLHAACRSGNTPLIELLLRYQADPNLANAEGLTPYDIAMVTGNREAGEMMRAGGGGHELPPVAAFLSALRHG